MPARARHAPDHPEPQAARPRRTADRQHAHLQPGGDALHRYLQEIGAFPLLPLDEEERLARRIRAGDEAALDALVRANLRFVVSIAKRYQNQGVSLGDLVNEGNLGLMYAARRFDPDRGVRFISYAVWWIRQSMLQALAEQGRVVRLPVHRAGTLYRIGRRSNLLRQQLGREPTCDEVAEGLRLPRAEVAATMSIARMHVSLDAPMAPGQDGRLLDHLPDAHPAPDDRLVREALHDTVRTALAALHDRERRILQLYFGLDGEEAMTLEQIGDLLGITRERVRQIKERALARLRHVAGARKLASFLG